MTITPEPSAYLLTQRLQLATRETVRTPTVESESQRSGLILIQPRIHAAQWRREIEEFVLTPGDLEWLRSDIRVPRSQVRERSTVARLLRQPPWGVDGVWPFISDLRGQESAVPMEADMAPYTLPSDPLPVPYECLHWPTLTPVLPVLTPVEPEPGAAWEGAITYACGAGRFPMTFTNTLLESTLIAHRIEIRPKPVPASSTAGPITLIATPEGAWTVTLAKEGGAWSNASGQIGLVVRAQLRRYDEDIDIEVLRMTQVFSLERVPVSFDDECVYAAAWAAQIERAKAERGPGEDPDEESGTGSGAKDHPGP